MGKMSNLMLLNFYPNYFKWKGKRSPARFRRLPHRTSPRQGALSRATEGRGIRVQGGIRRETFGHGTGCRHKGDP